MKTILSKTLGTFTHQDHLLHAFPVHSRAEKRAAS